MASSPATPAATSEPLRQRASAAIARAAGETIARLHIQAGGSASDATRLAELASQVWRANEQGDVCIETSSLKDPNAEAALRHSPVVAVLDSTQAPTAPLPLVFQGGLLYSYRHWFAEHTIAAGLLRLAAQPGPTSTANKLESSAADVSQAFAGLTPGTQQLRAVQLVQQRRLLLLSGGPGTGKTHTLGAIVRTVVHAKAMAVEPVRIALAAPTGKAAARLKEAIGSAASNSGDAADPVMISTGTLHRLLGYLPDGGFRHDRDNPLPYDLVIVDECSMVDAMMAAQLIAALGAHTRLILAGDKDQLSSVEAGAFFGAVCASSASLVEQCKVVLDINHRQSDAPQIVAWAEAVRSNTLQSQHADALPARDEQVQLHSMDESAAFEAMVGAAVNQYEPLVKAAGDLLTDNAAAQLLRAFGRVRVLAALRTGPYGVESLNRQIVARLVERLSLGESAWFAGRLVVVSRNVQALGLFNGDIGLAVSNGDGTGAGIDVVFESADGLRRFFPLQMPDCGDAFALTVHQSQGSDFDEVLLLPARAEHPLATRSALYTAMTRARRKLHIYAAIDDLAWAAGHTQTRAGGLDARLVSMAGVSR